MALPEVRRGELWWVSLGLSTGSEIRKTRPCVVMQRDAANEASPTTLVCPVTEARHRKAGIMNVLVRAGEGGLRKDSVVLCNQLRPVNRARLGDRIGKLDVETLRAVERGLRAILDL